MRIEFYRQGQHKPGFAHIAGQEAIAAQEYSLFIPLCVSCTLYGDNREPAEQRNLPNHGAEWDQKGKVFWQGIDDLVETLDGLTEA